MKTISKIKEINKKLDELLQKVLEQYFDLSLDKQKTACIWLKLQLSGEIQALYTQQILSLIEELEGKMPKEEEMEVIKKTDKFAKGIKTGWKMAIDQMRASIKELKKGL